jgi:hypothetical protein
MKKNFIKFFLLAFVFVFAISIATQAPALTAVDISVLQSAGIITQAQATQLTNLISVPTPTDTVTGNISSCVNLKNNMSYGTRDVSVNGEVTVLQDFLESNNYLSTSLTGFYGFMTVNAVKAFQSANNISPVGNAGSITRAEIASLTCGNTTNVAINPISSTVLVSNSAFTQSITVTYPNGGETIALGSKDSDFKTEWTSSNISGNVDVYLSSQDGSMCLIKQNVAINQGYLTATLGNNYQCPGTTNHITSGQYKVVLDVSGTKITDSSNNYFTVKTSTVTSTQTTVSTPSIIVTYPQTGNALDNSGQKSNGSIANIQWTSSNLGNSNVDITLYNSSGVSKLIATNVPNTGNYVWAYDPSLTNGQYKIVIKPYSKDAPVAGTGYFTISGSPTSASQTNTSAPTVSCSAQSLTSGQPGVAYPVDWTSQVSGGQSPYQYSWSLSGNDISYGEGSITSNNVAVSYASAGTKQGSVRIIDSNGKTTSASCSLVIPFIGSQNTTSSSCSSVSINGTTYTLSPCSMNVTMSKSAGNKNFSTMIIPSASGSYGFSVYGYGNGFPNYGIIANTSSGDTSGKQELNMYFNASYLNIGTYTGYLPIKVYQSSESSSEKELDLSIDLTVTQ